MSSFNNPIVTGHTEWDTSRICAVQNSLGNASLHLPAFTADAGDKGMGSDSCSENADPKMSEPEPLQQDECSASPFSESTQPTQEALLAPQGAGAEFSPDLQFYRSPDMREFPIPPLAPGITSCKICGMSFKPEVEPRPLYIQECSLLFLRVIPWFVGCLSSSLLI